MTNEQMFFSLVIGHWDLVIADRPLLWRESNYHLILHHNDHWPIAHPTTRGMSSENERNQRFVVLLRRADQACCAGLIVAGLVAMAISAIYQGGLRGRLINIEKADKQAIQFQLDINRADWPEWSVLPGIGEMLAKRIVQSRQTDGPFRSLDDLQRVRGIGPKTMENIREYLVPVDGR
jgi:competence protein ComEA